MAASEESPVSFTPDGVLATLRRVVRRRASWLATVAAVFLFSTGGADVLARYRCPHHDTTPTTHAGPSSDERVGTAGGGEHDGHEPCTCAGRCALGGAQAAALGRSPAAPSPGAITAVRVPPRPDDVLKTPVPYLHPFPNPPPVQS